MKQTILENVNCRLRKLLMLLLTVFLLSSVTICVHADSEGFSDALWTNESYDSTLGDLAGRRLYVYGLVDSVTQSADANSLPDNEIDLATSLPVTRLEVAEALYRICAVKDALPSCPFSDVPEEYRPAVGWLYEAGLSNGISSEAYGTGEITRVQFLTMLARLFAWDTISIHTAWGGTAYESRLNLLARQNGLLPVGVSKSGFTHGDMYLILLYLAKQYYPDSLTTVRPEMSRPRSIMLSAASFVEAEKQITEAIGYAPATIRVSFSESCPEDDFQAFREKYDTSNPAHKGEYPFTGIVNTGAGMSSCAFTQKSERSFELSFNSYAPAYLASLDTADWLRCYRDEAYSQSIAAFWNTELLPLAAKDLSDYEKAVAAQDLLCRVASYDWSEYDAIQRQGGSIHQQAHSLTGFLDGGVIVCDGYAKTYQWMLRCLGLDSFVVYGTGAGKSHAWNKVKLDGAWYNADVCWKDTGSGNTYFLKSDEFFQCNRHSFLADYVTTVYSSRKNYS